MGAGQNFLSLKKKLNCYKPKRGDNCVQLNCYTGWDDAMFRDHLHEFEAKMMACEPEPDDLNSIGVTSIESGATDTTTTNSDVGAGGIAVAMLAGRTDPWIQRSSSAATRPSGFIRRSSCARRTNAFRTGAAKDSPDDSTR